MEDNPLFNAGRRCFTNEGTNELDASIMTDTHGPGAVAGVKTIRNPITAARAVMEKSAHVMMVGQGPKRFAASLGITIVDPFTFIRKNAGRTATGEKRRFSQNGIGPWQ